MKILLVPYLMNVLILLPIALSTIFDLFATDQSKFSKSEGWQKLIGSVWFGILFLSILGIFYPLLFCPILMLQVLYKSMWLATYALPRLIKRRFAELPIGITVSFIFIVITYPLIIPWQLFFELAR